MNSSRIALAIKAYALAIKAYVTGLPSLIPANDVSRFSACSIYADVICCLRWGMYAVSRGLDIKV